MTCSNTAIELRSKWRVFSRLDLANPVLTCRSAFLEFGNGYSGTAADSVNTPRDLSLPHALTVLTVSHCGAMTTALPPPHELSTSDPSPNLIAASIRTITLGERMREARRRPRVSRPCRFPAICPNAGGIQSLIVALPLPIMAIESRVIPLRPGAPFFPAQRIDERRLAVIGLAR